MMVGGIYSVAALTILANRILSGNAATTNADFVSRSIRSWLCGDSGRKTLGKLRECNLQLAVASSIESKPSRPSAACFS